MVVRTEIKGEPYTVTVNKHGWGVVNTTSPINNIGRAYQVWKGPAGRPVQCSCPAFYNNPDKPCKHMEKVREIVEAGDIEMESASLEHPTKPVMYRFAKLASGAVRYERWEGGVRVTQVTLPYDTARERWRHLVKIGYKQFGFISKQGGAR